MNKYLYTVLLALIFFSCDDIVDDAIVETEAQINIIGLLTPENDSIRINVSRTLPIIGLEFNRDSPQADIDRFIIDDALVTLSNSSGDEIVLPFIENQTVYAESSTNFNIVPGERYELTVNIDNQTYTSSCSIPIGNITNIEQQLNLITDEFGFGEVQVDVNFMDIENENNFYIVGGEVLFDTDFIRLVEFDLQAFQTDNLGDGLPINANGLIPFVSFEGDETNQIDLILRVINAEESLFQLLRTSFLNSSNFDNPFEELAIQPNNINGEGATGLFAGYRYFEKRINLNTDQ